jgi:REP element-mobilizing transposase RayT
MTNHVHLLVTPEKPFSVMHTVQDLGRKFVRYIEMNPVRAGMEEHPGEYR